MPDVSPKSDILIVTVAKVESQAVMKVFGKETGKDPIPTKIDDRIYHDLGEMNGQRIFLALSEMGAIGLGASQQTVQLAAARSPHRLRWGGARTNIFTQDNHI